MATSSSASSSQPLRDIVLLIARVLLGAIMIAHGWQKLVTNGLEATGGGFAKLGIPMPEIAAAGTAFVEVGGGVLLILGLLTPVVGALFVVVLAGAYWFVHREDGLFASEGGWELVAALGLAAAVFAVVGSGRFSLDSVLFGKRRRSRAVAS